ARDLGRKLGCYGHVVQLRRTAVGAFDQAEAVTLDALRAASDGEPAADDRGAPDALQNGGPDAVAQSYLQPVATALRALDEVPLSEADAGRLRRGQSVIMRGRDAPIRSSGIAYATARGDVVALGEVDRGQFIPTRVFNLSR
ncbi:MAG: hypothetical protein AAFQ99_12000, partial [Pseudomonadota bacterium]